MITAKKYILEKDLFEPSTYRNYTFSKIKKLVIGKSLDPYLSKIMHFNSKGQIEKIERVHGSWTAYPPGHKPEVPMLEVVDYLEYHENKLKLITTKPIDNDKLELANTKYDYEDDFLVKVKKNYLDRGVPTIENTILHYERDHLIKVELNAEVEAYVKMSLLTDYQWNIKGQIIRRERKSRQYLKNQEDFVMIQKSLYSYNENGQ